jgi:hypothetical protein
MNSGIAAVLGVAIAHAAEADGPLIVAGAREAIQK